jgi:dTDP-6-deoxy-L-talose 4-dehydrogenase (NAD+)
MLRPGSVPPSSLSNHTVVQIDVMDPPSNAFELMGNPDVLIHLAWGGLPNYRSLHHFEVELPAQYNFLKGMIQSGLKNLVVTGTCFEYGMRSGSLHEDMEAKPTNPYGFAKDSLRRQLEYIKDDQPFALTWARLFYLLGTILTQTMNRWPFGVTVKNWTAAWNRNETENHQILPANNHSHRAGRPRALD